MNDKLKVFLKEFLGYGVLVSVILAVIAILTTRAAMFFSDHYDYHGSAGTCVFYLLMAAVFYFFARQLNLTGRRAIFYRVLFWAYLFYLVIIFYFWPLMSYALRGGQIAGLSIQYVLLVIFNPIVIISAAIIPFLVILPGRNKAKQEG